MADVEMRDPDDWMLSALPDWYDYAPCLGADHLFFPPKSQRNFATKAKAICAECPFREPCLEIAMTDSLVRHGSGIWGGTTAEERQHLARERALVGGA